MKLLPVTGTVILVAVVVVEVIVVVDIRTGGPVATI